MFVPSVMADACLQGIRLNIARKYGHIGTPSCRAAGVRPGVCYGRRFGRMPDGEPVVRSLESASGTEAKSRAAFGEPPGLAYSCPMTDAEWKDIDVDIVARRILAAVAKVRTLTESGTRDAFQQVRARYDRLRAMGAKALDDAPEDYWAGFRTLLRRRTFPTTEAAPKVPVVGKVQLPDAPRAKGERRIEVDGVAYFWRVPRRATGAQEDLTDGLFAIVRLADGSGPRFNLQFPQLHPSVSASPVPLRPSDIAHALRARPAAKKPGPRPSRARKSPVT